VNEEPFIRYMVLYKMECEMIHVWHIQLDLG
jgi:hypothetical protein